MKRKIFALTLSVILAFALAACGGETAAEPTPTATPMPTATPDPTPTPNPLSPDEFIQEVREAIDGYVGEGDTILDVTLDDNNLIVSVDLSDADIPNGFNLSDIAESRATSITDRILMFDDCDDLWETITVDFGEVGYATGSKSDIESSPYGRYFRDGVLKIKN